MHVLQIHYFMLQILNFALQSVFAGLRLLVNKAKLGVRFTLQYLGPMGICLKLIDAFLEQLIDKFKLADSGPSLA